MRKIICTFLVVSYAVLSASAQSSLIVRVKDTEEKKPLEGVAVRLDSLTGMTDSLGLIIFPDVRAGSHEVNVSSVGYFKRKLTIITPQHTGDTLDVKLTTSQEEMNEVVVVSTRTKQHAENLPTRVEVIGQDEVDERSTDKPSDISHVVKEQPGVQ
ncbi:MAG: hypothetical protein JWO03_3020, partial [Bacteroidetes bacterium]|nr:hypothetical protein [Bacteroidota bacterium]